SIKKLIAVPAVITLAVTLLRLVGELMHWSARLFNPAAGGGGAVVGISWLVPLFGIYFAWRLPPEGELPAGLGSAFGLALAGLLVMPALGFGAVKAGLPQQSLATLGVFAVASVIGIALAYRGWPALGRVLVAYWLAARIPVMIVMLVAMLGNW